MKRALISDIHGNLEALEAVLADIRGRNITEIVCLGDLVGEGANSRECVDLVMRSAARCVQGEYDFGVLFEPVEESASSAISVARRELERTCGDPVQDAKRWEFLAELPRYLREDGLLFVHGSPRSFEEYVFPEDAHHPRKMEILFTLIEGTCFQGHTHVPGVFTPDGRFIRPEETNCRFRIGNGKAMVNVGSVGQPRDGDPRACYVVLEDDWITYQRIEYLRPATIRKLS